ncbi:MAG TPA: hypothetical protein DEV93_06515 [Chloroflexi bacterium]|jgi:hypothetical protein|nr:hypothetical protein [Chloroflexota bacterium]
MINASEHGDESIVRAIVFHRSYQDNLLQVTDMAAGAVARAHERGGEQYRRLLGRKLRVTHYPGMPPSTPPR